MTVAGRGCKPLQPKKGMLEAVCSSRLKGNRVCGHLKLRLPWGAGIQATGFQQLWRTTAANTQRFICNLPSLFVQTGHHSLLDTCTTNNGHNQLSVPAGPAKPSGGLSRTSRAAARGDAQPRAGSSGPSCTLVIVFRLAERFLSAAVNSPWIHPLLTSLDRKLSSALIFLHKVQWGTLFFRSRRLRCEDGHFNQHYDLKKQSKTWWDNSALLSLLFCIHGPAPKLKMQTHRVYLRVGKEKVRETWERTAAVET